VQVVGILNHQIKETVLNLFINFSKHDLTEGQLQYWFCWFCLIFVISCHPSVIFNPRKSSLGNPSEREYMKRPLDN